MVSSLITIPKNGTLYENMFLELFLDLYIVSAILAVFPKKVRRGLRVILYIILYVTAAADTYCFVNFGSTLNPSMLMLVGETNSSEASSFLSALISAEVLCHQFCRVGGYVMIQGGSRFSMDIPPYVIAGRDPIRYVGINIIGLRRHGFSNELIELIHNTYRLIYGTGTRAENIQKVRSELQVTKEIEYILNFIEGSKRGIIK